MGVFSHPLLALLVKSLNNNEAIATLWKNQGEEFRCGSITRIPFPSLSNDFFYPPNCKTLATDSKRDIDIIEVFFTISIYSFSRCPNDIFSARTTYFTKHESSLLSLIQCNKSKKKEEKSNQSQNKNHQFSCRLNQNGNTPSS